MLPPDKTNSRTGTLVETHKRYDLRIVLFYPCVAALLLLLIGGFAYHQLVKTDEYNEAEKRQTQRRILYPGSRGNITDRDGRDLAINRARYTLTLNLDDLRSEFLREFRQIRKNYREADDKNIPTSAQLWSIARHSVVQRYLDQVNRIINRDEQVDGIGFRRHFNQQLLIPYTLLDDLAPEEYARLVEQIPVLSPLQLTATSLRYYPHKTLAAHVLGYVQASDELNAEGFPGEDLTTFKQRGTIGKNGLELSFNEHLQGKTGFTTYRVDPAGYRIDPPRERQFPVKGKDLQCSLDLDIQEAAEKAMGTVEEGGNAGSAVAIDVLTGEVLVLVSKPDYDLNDFYPRMPQSVKDKMDQQGSWENRALRGLYEPGSTFKLITAIAGFRNGKLQPDTILNCGGAYMVGNHSFKCHNSHAHGDINFHDALAKSCNVFFYQEGLALGAQAMADEARRFGLDRPSGIELPDETTRMIVPDPAWKLATNRGRWTGGDTVQMAIGQSFLQLTPLDMACFMASVARNQIRTPPTLLHDPARAVLHTEPIGLTPPQRKALLNAMRETASTGTAKILTTAYKLGFLDIAAKTGTAQKDVYNNGKRERINYAWFVGFAPADNPRIAICITLEGDIPNEEFGGGAKAAPVAGAIFKRYFEKHPEQSPARSP